MKPILYPAGEVRFNSNGLGILTDVVGEPEVLTGLNGAFEAMIQYPITGIHFAEIRTGCYLVMEPDPVSRPQRFEIYRITKPMSGIITIYAHHIAYQMRDICVSPFTAPNCGAALFGLAEHADTSCDFTMWTDKSTEATMTVTQPASMWSLLGGTEGGILDTYGGEYEFDNMTVKLHNHRGADRGVRIRYGKNLTSLEQDANIANMFTGVHPFWIDPDGKAMELPEKIILAEGTFPRQRIRPLDLSDKFETKPTVEQLRAEATSWMRRNNVGVPEISWTVEFAQLDQTDEYRDKALLERVLLGDTVGVDFDELGVHASSRVVETRYNPVLERYISVTLGRVRANVADTIASQGQAVEQIQKPSAIQQAVNRATGWITGGGGYMVAVKDAAGNWVELCSLDDPDINKAVNVWRWNNGGFGHSKNGYNGPYRLALTQDGHIVADFITTGTLDAALVTIKNLVVDHLKSTNDKGSGFEIYKGKMILISASGQCVAFEDVQSGFPILAMDNVGPDGTRLQHAEYAPGFIKLGKSFDGNEPGLWVTSQQLPNGGGPVAMAVDDARVRRGLKVGGKFSAARNLIFDKKVDVGQAFFPENAANYNLFALVLGGSSKYKTPVLAFRVGNQIRGIGGQCGTSSARKEIHFVTITVQPKEAENQGDKWLLEDAGYHHVNMDGTWEAGTRLSLHQVWAIC